MASRSCTGFHPASRRRTASVPSDRDCFAEIFPDTEFPVCSWHHQGLRKLGAGLQVKAHAPDGVVEGVVFDSHPFAIGVQWHPEMQALEDVRQLRVFAALVDRARARRFP